MSNQTVYVTREAFGDRVFRFCFGAYGDIAVYATGQGWEDAFEAAVDVLIDRELWGIFTEINYQEAASELGYGLFEELEGDGLEEVMQHAEVDMTVIGHTTVGDMGTAAIPSWEWSGREVFDEERDNVLTPYLVGFGLPGCLYDETLRFEDLEDARQYVADMIMSEREIGNKVRAIANGEAWSVTRDPDVSWMCCDYFRLENLSPATEK